MRKPLNIMLGLAAVAGMGLIDSSVRADSIFFVSSGTVTEPATTLTATETVDAQIGGFGALSSLTYTLSGIPDASGDFDGTGFYSGSSGNLDFSLALSQASGQFSGTAPVSEALDGTISFTGGTANYAGAAGSGTFDVNYLFPEIGDITAVSGTLLSANITVPSTTPSSAVPLPKSAAAGMLLMSLLVPAGWARRRVAPR